ncbi:hypothetical protein CLOM_g4089, partial [Closterium sp. NIES-68]
MISSQALRIPGASGAAGATAGACGLAASTPVQAGQHKGGAAPVACVAARTTQACARGSVSATAPFSQGIRSRSSVTKSASVTSRSRTLNSTSSPTFGDRPFALETRVRAPATPCAHVVWRGAARNGSARNSLAEGQGMGEVVKSGVTRAQENLDAFVRFTRPHTMIGT